ncbi:hypothetical protein ACFL3T_02395 [Patescibacteria group bacterium]
MGEKEKMSALDFIFIAIGMLLIISSFRVEVIRSLIHWNAGPESMGYNMASIAIVVLAVWLIRKGLAKG